MGSTSTTTNHAVDNRQAITDQAFGFSTYGGKVAWQAPVFDFSTTVAASGRSNPQVGGAGSGGGVNISMLDAGAVSRSFDFAETSLSAMLESVINGQRAQQDAANYQADTVSAALQESAKVQAQAQEKTLAWLSGNGKILGGVAVAVLVGVWILRGRKK